jgi:hypothetical protein
MRCYVDGFHSKKISLALPGTIELPFGRHSSSHTALQGHAAHIDGAQRWGWRTL